MQASATAVLAKALVFALLGAVASLCNVASGTHDFLYA
jgi:hypothetical protein